MNEDENYLVIGGRLYLDERGFVQRNGKLYAKWLANHDREVAAKAWEEGAESAWQTTGEGANAEYPGNDGAMTWREYTNEIANPYRANQLEGGSDD